MKNRYIAKRYWNTERSPMGEVSENAKKYNDVINLSLGDPDITTDVRIIEAASQDAKAGHTHYTEFLGDSELRASIIKDYKDSYNLEVDMSEVMVVVGGCHGMYLALEAILDDEDEVIVHSPYFTPYPQQIRLARGKCVELETLEEEGFQINVERLKEKITNRTKAIIINTPNNPTGASFSKETLEAIAEVVVEHDLLVISDDIYTAFCFDREFIPFSSIQGMKERTITVASFSKDYVMTGWRIGYVIAPSYLIDCMRDINEGVCFTAPSVSQRAALHALALKDIIQKPVIDIYKKRVHYAYNRIKNIPNMSVREPEATFYLFINIKETGLDSVSISKKILDEAHVLVLPGVAFGDCGEGYIRLACTVEIDQLKEAFDRIEKMDLFSKQ
jgi:aspartate/methionine/tyrosine aminotransferase